MNWQTCNSDSVIESGKTLLFRSKCGRCEFHAESEEYTVPETDHFTVLKCSKEGCGWEGSILVSPLGWNNQMSVEYSDDIDHLEWKFV